MSYLACARVACNPCVSLVDFTKSFSFCFKPMKNFVLWYTLKDKYPPSQFQGVDVIVKGFVCAHIISV